MNDKYLNIDEFEEEEGSSFNIKTVIDLLLLNWQWIVVSILFFTIVAWFYVRYQRPIYQTSAKLLVKEEQNNSVYRGNQMLANMQDLGFLSNSAGIDNEVEILKANIIAEQVVKNLKLYVSYERIGHIADGVLYKNTPVFVNIDELHLRKMEGKQIVIEMEKKGAALKINGKFFRGNGGKPFEFEQKITQFPAIITNECGTLTFTRNVAIPFTDRVRRVRATISAVEGVAERYVRSMSVEPTSKTTTIAQIVLNDFHAQRASDYLQELAHCYNVQANEDKNEVALKTEEFINERLRKINAELGQTEGALESYKKQNRVTELKLDATSTLGNAADYTKSLTEINSQIQLLNYVSNYVSNNANRNQVIPANIGLTDGASVALITKYNEMVLERNRMLQSASMNSPIVEQINFNINELTRSIKQALNQAKQGLEITRDGLQRQYGTLSSRIANTPQQERVLTQIGRKREIESNLYLMLLQKREENSISLAATADKGKLIDKPKYNGVVSPKKNVIVFGGFIIGLVLPFIVIYLRKLLRYKIEGHEDVETLTTIPIIADVAVASEHTKTDAGIVVHENKNDHMEEIFRGMRTNLQFIMKPDDKVILFTSTTSGEGKTFNALNLAVSFALLKKKVVLVGLDIRRPKLAQAFGIKDREHGISTFLSYDHPSMEDLKAQIVMSKVNANLDLLMAGPIPPNPAELIARDNLDTAFKYLREIYDIIIIDTAPVGLVSDTLLIGRVADASIYVCRADYTTRNSFKLINSLHDEKKLPNICMIVNGVDMSKKKYGYYYGYGKYGHYGRYGHSYGSYGYGYGGYGYGNSYSNKNDNSIKLSKRHHLFHKNSKHSES